MSTSFFNTIKHMKFAQYLDHHSIPEWSKKYIRYKKLKGLIKKASFAAQSSVYESGNVWMPLLMHDEREVVDSWSRLIETDRREDLDFVKMLESNFKDFVVFFEERVAESRIRYESLERQCEILGLYRDEPERRRSVETDGMLKVANPRKVLEKATLEFYRILEMIENYRILNELAVKKILKKFQKQTGGKIDMLTHHTQHILDQMTQPKEMLKHTEDLYVKYFGSASRKVALEKLKNVRDCEKARTIDYWRAGLFTGLSLPALVAVTYQLSMAIGSFTEERILILQTFSGLFIPILFVYLFAYCLMILRAQRINYVLIFELDPRSFLLPIHCAEIGGFMLLIFSYTLLLFTYEQVLGIASMIYPVVLLVTLLAFFFNPFHILYYNTRYWILCLLGSIVKSGSHPVLFKEFFICDILSSTT